VTSTSKRHHTEMNLSEIKIKNQKFCRRAPANGMVVCWHTYGHLQSPTVVCWHTYGHLQSPTVVCWHTYVHLQSPRVVCWHAYGHLQWYAGIPTVTYSHLQRYAGIPTVTYSHLQWYAGVIDTYKPSNFLKYITKIDIVQSHPNASFAFSFKNLFHPFLSFPWKKIGLTFRKSSLTHLPPVPNASLSASTRCLGISPGMRHADVPFCVAQPTGISSSLGRKLYPSLPGKYKLTKYPASTKSLTLTHEAVKDWPLLFQVLLLLFVGLRPFSFARSCETG
jgi:hypothetical protein